jgi:hypothetical protein
VFQVNTNPDAPDRVIYSGKQIEGIQAPMYGGSRGGGGDIMRKGIVVALIMYVLISGGGAMFGPFSSSVDCESYRVNQGSFVYCLPLWQ